MRPTQSHFPFRVRNKKGFRSSLLLLLSLTFLRYTPTSHKTMSLHYTLGTFSSSLSLYRTKVIYSLRSPYLRAPRNSRPRDSPPPQNSTKSDIHVH